MSSIKITNDTIVLQDVNASWPKLDEPDALPGSEPKYSIRALLRIEDNGFDEFKNAVKSKIPAGFKPSADKLPWREVSDKLPEAWGDASAYQITFKSSAKQKPQCFDAKGNLIPATEISGGDKVSVAFQVYPVENAFGKFVTLQLKAVLRLGADLEFGGAGGKVDADVFGITPPAASAAVDPFSDDMPF